MKLWEIKAQALRLMFADTDIEFSLAEFTSGTIYENSNTREKLVRMEDSIKRAIDLYYQYVGEEASRVDLYLNTSVEDEVTTYLNEIDLSEQTILGYPTRIDVFIYNDDGDLLSEKHNQDYTYDRIAEKIYFIMENYTAYEANILFRVWYKVKKLNVSLGGEDTELTYDLNSIYIPEEVQRKIPLFVKGELYEEDEAGIAQSAMNQYISFLYTLRKPFSHVQKKTRHAKIFDKTN